VSTLVSFEVSDPRDTVFALLAIARDNPLHELKPSQKKGLLDVYSEFIKHCVQTSKSLDMMCRHWAPSRTTPPPAANKLLVFERFKTRKRFCHPGFDSWTTRPSGFRKNLQRTAKCRLPSRRFNAAQLQRFGHS
jgi:hypothetical protein